MLSNILSCAEIAAASKEVKMASGRENSALTSRGIADKSSKELHRSISISSVSAKKFAYRVCDQNKIIIHTKG